MDVVVGVALVDAGRVLAARRSAPPSLAGQWEFPGGKVEPGEHREAAAVREIAEELGCDIEVTGWLPGRTSVRDGLVLMVATARLVARDPVPTEHDAVCWLHAGELGRFSWVEADVPFVDRLREQLGSPG